MNRDRHDFKLDYELQVICPYSSGIVLDTKQTPTWRDSIGVPSWKKHALQNVKYIELVQTYSKVAWNTVRASDASNLSNCRQIQAFCLFLFEKTHLHIILTKQNATSSPGAVPFADDCWDGHGGKKPLMFSWGSTFQRNIKRHIHVFGLRTIICTYKPDCPFQVLSLQSLFLLSPNWPTWHSEWFCRPTTDNEGQGQV